MFLFLLLATQFVVLIAVSQTTTSLRIGDIMLWGVHQEMVLPIKTIKRDRMSEEKDAIEQVGELIDTMLSLAPTNNRISQFIILSEGQDYQSMKEMYPDFFEDRKTRSSFLKALGMKIDSDGKIGDDGYDSVAYNLRSTIINSLFSLFERETVLNKVSASLLTEIPNLREEWVWIRLQAIQELSKEADSPAKLSVMLLKILRKLREEGGYDYQRLESKKILENMPEPVDESVMATAIDILTKYKLLRQSGEQYELSDDLWSYKLLVDDLE